MSYPCAAQVSFVHIGCQEGLFWGVVTAQMSSSLIVASFLAHGVLSAACCVATGSDRWGLSAESKALGLTLVSVVGLSVTAVGLHIAPSGSESSTTSPSGLLLLLGTASFGLTDFPAQALLRGSVCRAFQGSPLLEDAMANIILCLTSGNIALFVAGPMSHPVHQAIACVLVGLLSVVCLALTNATAAPLPAAKSAAVALPFDTKL